MRLVGLLTGLVLLGATAGCDVPVYMRVGHDDDPRNQNELVRFRTTYYFRVFDYCQGRTTDENGKVIPAKPIVPLNDTLLRFRMTGKAHPLTNKIRFESGVLRRDEIDPFGASVVYDKEHDQFYFQSREETEYAARRSKRLADFDALVERYERLARQKADEEKAHPGAKIVSDKAFDELEELMTKAFKGMEPPDPPGRASARDESGSISCPPGLTLRRGFQILGPEGWRTFNQDERLLLVMSTSPQPLISAMRELAGRVLNEQQSTAEGLLPIAQEELRTLGAVRAAEQKAVGESDQLDQLLDDVIAAFDGKQEGK